MIFLEWALRSLRKPIPVNLYVWTSKVTMILLEYTLISFGINNIIKLFIYTKTFLHLSKEIYSQTLIFFSCQTEVDKRSICFSHFFLNLQKKLSVSWFFHVQRLFKAIKIFYFIDFISPFLFPPKNKSEEEKENELQKSWFLVMPFCSIIFV